MTVTAVLRLGVQSLLAAAATAAQSFTPLVSILLVSFDAGTSSVPNPQHLQAVGKVTGGGEW